MMPAETEAQVRPAPQAFPLNPLACMLITASLGTTFWFGIVWLAERMMH